MTPLHASVTLHITKWKICVILERNIFRTKQIKTNHARIRRVPTAVKIMDLPRTFKTEFLE